MSTQFSFGRLFGAILTAAGQAGRHAVRAFAEWREGRRREQQRREVIAKHTKKGAAAPAADAKPPVVAAAEKAAPDKADGPRRRPLERPIPPTAARSRSRRPRSRRRSRMPAPTLPLDLEPAGKAPAERRKGEFTLPPAALLDAAKTERKIDERELMDGARLLEEKCREFSVEGSVAQIHPGPVVTTFEFKPDAGVKYSKVTGLADDLCLAMRAESVLIDRIPGKSTVGIQIPNATREQISLRELLESEAYRRSTSKLTIALGKTHPRRAVHGGSRRDAAPAHRGLDGLRQVGRHQRHAHEHPVPLDARRCADDHDRSQAPRARDVRGHPAPAHAGRRRSEAGVERPALGRPRDGRALQDARRRGRPEHRAVQPQHPARHHREAHAAGGRASRSRSPSSSSSSTSWPT